MSAFSTTSKNSFPSAPMVWIETAMIAAIGPIERIAVSSPAMTISGKARRISMMRRTTQRTGPAPTRLRRGEKAQAERQSRRR